MKNKYAVNLALALFKVYSYTFIVLLVEWLYY